VLHNFLVHKWYFDEAIDFLIVRPSLMLGRLADSVLERTVVEGVLTGGAVAAVRAGSAAVRRWQTGFLRYYAAAMVVCLSGVALYFLISS
jgi:NADH-quinone oxidoreductase subunit L